MLSRALIGLLFLIGLTYECHYSCLACTSQTYSSCTACPRNEGLLKASGYESSIVGVCSSLDINNGNIFGIFLLLFVIAACISFPKQQIIYIAIFIQSLGLLYLVETLWSPSTHYILASLTYLMVFTKIQYSYSQKGGNINAFKSQTFFKTAQTQKSMPTLSVINLALIILMILIPIFKIIRRKINKERPNCLPDPILEKILLAINCMYFMIIQETVVGLYFCYKFGQSSIFTISLSIFYFLSLIFFLINQWFYPFPFFRTKIVQMNIIILKIVTPSFIGSETNNHYIIFILLAFFYLIDLILTNKNRNNSSINRQLYYKIYGIIVLILFACYYAVNESNLQKDNSKPLGVVSTLALSGVLYLFIMEICLQFRDNYCIKEKPQIAIDGNLEITREQIRIDKDQRQELTIVIGDDKNNPDYLFLEKGQSNNYLAPIEIGKHQHENRISSLKKEDRLNQQEGKSNQKNVAAESVYTEQEQQKVEGIQPIPIAIDHYGDIQTKSKRREKRKKNK